MSKSSLSTAKNAGSTFNVVLSSFALFLILLPEPMTTFIGLVLLSLLKKTPNKNQRDDKPSYYRRDLLYGGITNRRFALGLHTPTPANNGLLSPAQISQSPVYSTPAAWTHLRKSINDINAPEKTVAATRGELPVVKANVPSMYYNQHEWKSYRNTNKNKTAATLHISNITGAGELPATWPNMPEYYSNPEAWQKVKKQMATAPQNNTSSSPHGQLPLPWPNMPETRFTSDLHRATH